MKRYLTLTTILAAALLAVPAAPAAADSRFIKEGSYLHTSLVEVCTHTRNDQPGKLFNTLREYRISKQSAVDKVMCNKQQLLTFARNNNAQRVVAMLQPYERLPERKVTISDITAPAN